MDIQKIYTKTMHKALQNALKQGFRIDYKPAGGFISHIHNIKQGVIFNFNTWIGSHIAITAESFINYDYNNLINDLYRAYEKNITDCTFRLKNEYYQDRYSVKF